MGRAKEDPQSSAICTQVNKFRWGLFETLTQSAAHTDVRSCVKQPNDFFNALKDLCVRFNGIQQLLIATFSTRNLFPLWATVETSVQHGLHPTFYILIL